MTFIVIEGTDGSGKGTQVALLKDKLVSDGKSVEVADFPQYGKPSAALAEAYLNGIYGSIDSVSAKQASIFYAVDRFDASFSIRAWLSEGKIVLGNRYVSSNMGHQTAKLATDSEKEEFLTWVEDLEYGVFNLPKPDMTILLFVPPEITAGLVEQKADRAYITDGNKDIAESDLDHQKKASEAYLYCAKKYGWKVINCAPEGVMLSKEAVNALIYDAISEVLHA